jgi:2-succinyl-6-hydroxy-2,4-cyclohexadiene-1-carboxylate synthase
VLFSRQLKKGSGIPIVFLHGFLGNSSDWDEVCKYLPECNCIGYDLPGHGNSSFTEHLQIDLPYFHVVGYSMGGRLALTLPKEKIASLTLLSVHPGLKTEEEKKQRWESDQKWATLLRELPIDEFLLRWYDQRIFCSFKPDLSKRRSQNMQHLEKALLHYSLAKQPYYRLDHVAVGAKDEKFLSLYKHPIIIENASHAVHLENPKAVAQLIKQRVGL